MQSFRSAAVVAALGLACTASFAQSASFTGFHAGVNLNFVGGNTDISSGSSKISLGENSNHVSLQAGYGIGMGGNGVMTVGGSYSIGDVAAGTITSGSTAYKLRLKNQYSVYIEPGYKTNNSLVYAKLAYVNGKGEESLNAISGSETFTATGFGAGIRTMLDSKMYVQVELLQSNFGEKTFGTSTYKPSSTTASVGVGVKF